MFLRTTIVLAAAASLAGLAQAAPQGLTAESQALEPATCTAQGGPGSCNLVWSSYVSSQSTNNEITIYDYECNDIGGGGNVNAGDAIDSQLSATVNINDITCDGNGGQNLQFCYGPNCIQSPAGSCACGVTTEIAAIASDGPSCTCVCAFPCNFPE